MTSRLHDFTTSRLHDFLVEILKFGRRAMSRGWLAMLTVFVFACSGYSVAAIYVAANGSDTSGNGTKANPYLTIQHAISQATVNETIYVKRGWYSSSASNPIVINKSGLKLIGYDTNEGSSTQPADLDDGHGVPADYDAFYEPNGPTNYLQAGLYPPQPTIIGDGRSVTTPYGVGVDIAADNVEFRNFGITNEQNGLRAFNSDFCEFKNVVVFNVGDVNFDLVPGNGIWIDSSLETECLNSFVLNAVTNAFLSKLCNEVDFYDCQAYCDDDQTGLKSSTDYYMLLVDSTDSTVSGCVVARKKRPGQPAPSHSGHGFVIQAQENEPGHLSSGNTIRLCQAESMNDVVELRGHSVANIIEDVLSDVVPETEMAGATRVGGHVTFFSCSYGNTFRRLDLANCLSGVYASDGWRYHNPDLPASQNNVFEDCVFSGCKQAAVRDSMFLGFKDTNGNYVRTPWRQVKNNQYINCTFNSDGGGYNGSNNNKSVLFWCSRESEGNVMQGCTFNGFDDIYGGFQGNQYYQLEQNGPVQYGPMPIYIPGYTLIP